jgi:hypothetical protein
MFMATAYNRSNQVSRSDSTTTITRTAGLDTNGKVVAVNCLTTTNRGASNSGRQEAS